MSITTTYRRRIWSRVRALCQRAPSYHWGRSPGLTAKCLVRRGPRCLVRKRTEVHHRVKHFWVTKKKYIYILIPKLRTYLLQWSSRRGWRIRIRVCQTRGPWTIVPAVRSRFRSWTDCTWGRTWKHTWHSHIINSVAKRDLWKRSHGDSKVQTIRRSRQRARTNCCSPSEVWSRAHLAEPTLSKRRGGPRGTGWSRRREGRTSWRTLITSSWSVWWMKFRKTKKKKDWQIFDCVNSFLMFRETDHTTFLYSLAFFFGSFTRVGKNTRTNSQDERNCEWMAPDLTDRMTYMHWALCKQKATPTTLTLTVHSSVVTWLLTGNT